MVMLSSITLSFCQEQNCCERGNKLKLAANVSLDEVIRDDQWFAREAFWQREIRQQGTLRGLERSGSRNPLGASLCSRRVRGTCLRYQYHQDRKAFDRDRQRSRAVQRKGYKVLQYSGGEIWRDPIRTSSDLYEHLVEAERELEKKSAVQA